LIATVGATVRTSRAAVRSAGAGTWVATGAGAVWSPLGSAGTRASFG
jgi:hypothetical protein